MVYFAVFDLRNIYCWGVSHVKNSKNGSGIWVDPPPVFSKFPHFPVFFLDNVPKGRSPKTSYEMRVATWRPALDVLNLSCQIPFSKVLLFCLFSFSPPDLCVSSACLKSRSASACVSPPHPVCCLGLSLCLLCLRLCLLCYACVCYACFMLCLCLYFLSLFISTVRCT